MLPDGFGESPASARRVRFGDAGADSRCARAAALADVADGRGDSACAAAHNRRERDGGRGRGARPRRAARTPCARACASFAGVPHRLEEVAEHDGVLYVNDSKATNVAARARRDRGVRAAACTRSSAAPQGRRLRRAARRRSTRARQRRLPDRRRRRSSSSATSRAPVPLHQRGDLDDRRGRGARGRRSPATWSCSRPPAPASTSTRTTRRAARISAAGSQDDPAGASKQRPDGRRQRNGEPPPSRRSSTRSSTRPRSACSRSAP